MDNLSYTVSQYVHACMQVDRHSQNVDMSILGIDFGTLRNI